MCGEVEDPAISLFFKKLGGLRGGVYHKEPNRGKVNTPASAMECVKNNLFISLLCDVLAEENRAGWPSVHRQSRTLRYEADARGFREGFWGRK